MTIDWFAPDNGGSPITAYTVLIRHSDGVSYSTELLHCNGADPVVRDANECNVPVSILISSPFNLAWGTQVYAKVIATNIYGDSDTSPVGAGANLVTNPDPPVNLQEYLPDRTISTLGITWSNGAFNGGDVILDYRISIADESGVYSYLADGLTSAHYTATGLNYGTVYSFKVESRNSYDYSAFSAPISLLCAIEPAKPLAPTTSIYLSNVIIDWEAPNNHGTEITNYKVYLRESDGVTFTQESVDCDGTDETVKAETKCMVSLFTVIEPPYSLTKGDHIFAKVIAVNFYGDSEYSDEGNGAVTQLVPDAPLNLANNAAITDANNIGLTWSPGLDDGGAVVIDYKLWFALSNEEYTEANSVEGILDELYTLTRDFVDGSNYKLKLQARNSVGFSLFSVETIIRAARISDPPTNVITTIDKPNLIISWTPPYDGGSPITSYTIQI